MRVPLLLIILLLAVQSTFAGGTVEWEFHAFPILKKHPNLLKTIESSLDVRPVGWGVRVGRDASGNPTIPELGVGARIPPFEFPARLKGSTGDYDLMLIIHDPSGLSNPGDGQTYIEIRPKT
jgi:hypothetical protein